MLRIWAGIVVLGLLLSACSGGGHPQVATLDAATVARSPSADPPSSRASTDPKQLLITMLTGLLSGPGRIETEVTRGSKVVSRYTSSFDPRRDLVIGDLRLTGLRGAGDLPVLYLHDQAYVRYRPTCWLAGSALPDRSLAASVPTASVLDLVERTETQTYDSVSARVTGQLPVARVAALVGPVVGLVGPFRRLTGGVRVTLPVEDGAVAELDVGGRDLAGVLRPELGLGPADVRRLERLRLTVRFAPGADPTQPLDPPTSQQLADSATTGCMTAGAV